MYDLLAYFVLKRSRISLIDTEKHLSRVFLKFPAKVPYSDEKQKLYSKRQQKRPTDQRFTSSRKFALPISTSSIFTAIASTGAAALAMLLEPMAKDT
jgi:hypothetical protein